MWYPENVQEEWDIAPCLWTVTQSFLNWSWVLRVCLFLIHIALGWPALWGQDPFLLPFILPEHSVFPEFPSCLSITITIYNISLLSWLIFFPTPSHLNWYRSWNHRFVGLYFLYVLKLKSQLLKLMKLIYVPFQIHSCVSHWRNTVLACICSFMFDEHWWEERA